MDPHALAPWLLLADWRADLPGWLWVDLASWPADVPIHPLPPVPLIGVGSAALPQAARMDALVPDAASARRIGAAIAAGPQTAAIIVQLLRATEGLPADQAMTLESLAFAALQGGTAHARWLMARPPVAAPPAGALQMLRQGRRLDLILDRPGARNAIDRVMRDALFDAFTIAARDDGIRLVRLRACGRCFSIGAELAEFGTTRDPVAAHAIRLRSLPAWPLLGRHFRFEAHVHGACIGAGLELAAFADRLTASPDAWFQLPEARMGILPGFGGCVSVPRRIGRQRAAGLMLTGRRIDARTALNWGLVDAIMDQPPRDHGGADLVGGKPLAPQPPGQGEQT